jgi:phage/conjugal plasmid C-4 type zinc finger TraR family protein
MVSEAIDASRQAGNSHAQPVLVSLVGLLRIAIIERDSTQGMHMAGGFAKDGAVQEQIDATVDDAVQRARSRLPQGRGLAACEECGVEIPPARRQALPGVRLCVACQAGQDRAQAAFSGYNRRGSKDSQLR